MGTGTLFRVYGVPWLAMSHWIMMVVFLQHTDPVLPHYRAAKWTYARGALATMDRDFLGWQGRYFLHNVSPDPCSPVSLRRSSTNVFFPLSLSGISLSYRPPFLPRIAPLYVITSNFHLLFLNFVHLYQFPDNLPEATKYAEKLLGSDYRYCDTPVFKCLWDNQLHCQYVDNEGKLPLPFLKLIHSC